jgi:site-specific recombinase XerD
MSRDTTVIPFRQPDAIEDPKGARDHALLLFLYNSGARASEAASLRIGDIDWHARSVRIVGKGSKERRCPLWAETIEQLHHLAGERAHDAHVFLNRRGEPITRYGIHTMIERYVAKLRVTTPQLRGKRISPHVVRHSTAMHLLQAGVDINTIRARLGHVSIDTTSIYAETDLATKKRALATLDRGRTRRSAGGWARQPDVMEFLRSLEPRGYVALDSHRNQTGLVLRHILVCATYW